MMRGGQRGRATAQTASVPAPSLGWNLRDPITEMKPAYAPLLDNFYPDNGIVRLRKGYTLHSSLPGGLEVGSLMNYASGTTEKLFAAGANAIYDVTASGAPTSVVTGLVGTRFSYVNFGTTGGQYLVLANGLDAVREYNGTTWSAPSITGVPTSDLIHVQSHARRLFFIQKNTLKAWYLDALAITGAALALDFSSLCRMGGYLMAMGSWTLDGGNGPDDLAVWITSKGEVLVFTGLDPAVDFALVGRYYVAPPLGRRCLIQAGGDLLILTRDGVISMKKSLTLQREQAKGFTLSDLINPAILTSAKAMGDQFGWEGIPFAGKLYCNIPQAQANQKAHQYTLNIASGAWCRFRGMKAACWGIYADRLFFGDFDGNIYEAEIGSDDNGTYRTGEMKTAWNYFGSRGRNKRFTMLRPIITTNGAIAPAYRMNVDFNDQTPAAGVPVTVDPGAQWDLAEWDETLWAQGEGVRRDVGGVTGIGTAASIRLKVASAQFDMAINAFDVAFEPGGFL